MVMFVSYACLALLGVLVFAVIAIGPQLLEALRNVVPQEFHQYIDNIIQNWPF